MWQVQASGARAGQCGRCLLCIITQCPGDPFCFHNASWASWTLMKNKRDNLLTLITLTTPTVLLQQSYQLPQSLYQFLVSLLFEPCTNCDNNSTVVMHVLLLLVKRLRGECHGEDSVRVSFHLQRQSFGPYYDWVTWNYPNIFVA